MTRVRFPQNVAITLQRNDRVEWNMDTLNGFVQEWRVFHLYRGPGDDGQYRILTCFRALKVPGTFATERKAMRAAQGQVKAAAGTSITVRRNGVARRIYLPRSQ